MNYIILILSYLLGAVPFGFLAGKVWGIDIRTQGSGNIGATNVFRTLGKGPGIVVLLLDALKGFVPAFFFPTWFSAEPAWGLGFGIAAILGHNFPVYLRFKGGKGVATTGGVLLGAAPAAALIGVGVWVVVFLAGGYVSLGSMCAAVAVPVAGWWLYGSAGAILPGALTALGLMVIWRHRSNIQRIRSGSESRFTLWRRSS